MRALYPRIPVQLNRPELKKALAVGLHFLAIGKNPEEAHFNGSTLVKTKIILNSYAEDCLEQLKQDPAFKSQNDIIVLCLQYLNEASKKRPQILNTRLGYEDKKVLTNQPTTKREE